MKLFKILFLFLTISATSQVPSIVWQRSYGSPGNDKVVSITKGNNNGFVVAGYADSNGGDISNHHGVDGSDDIWVYEIDSIGTILWSSLLGGTGGEQASTVIQTLDGGFAINGSSYSNDGDVYNSHWPSDEIWVVKTDSTGNILWQNSYGGSDDELSNDIKQTSDSGFIIIGNTDSNDGDVHGYNGNGDIFLVRTNKAGLLLWTKSIGGSSGDDGTCVETTANGCFLIGGNTISNDGDISGHHNTSTGDIWIAKVNSFGVIQWQRCYGGTGVDNIARILMCSDGGFYITGLTGSNDGDVTGNFGFYDYWVARCDSGGNILWQHCYGGISFEGAYSSNRTSDGGLIIVGVTDSDSSFMVGANNGIDDIWILKIDSIGNFEWGKCLGGTNFETGDAVIQTTNGDFLVTGSTLSSDGDVTFNHGGKDAWIIKLSSPFSGISQIENELKELTITSQHQQLLLRFFSKHPGNARASVFDSQGKMVLSEKIKINEGINYHLFNDVNFAQGMYYVNIEGDAQGSGKVVVQ